MIPRVISRFAVLLAFLAAVAAPGVSHANDIYVNRSCSLREAIENHNAQGQPYKQCAAGSGNDTIYVHEKELHVSAPLLPVINGILTIVRDFPDSCANIRGNAYLNISPGATVTLWGIGMQATSTFLGKPSVIINNGGNLTIKQFGPACRFSNEHTRNAPDRGGILYNENGGKVTISGADFVFSHAYAGGAIYSNGGTITITDALTPFATNFIDDTAHYGGAIFLEGGAALNIASNNFSFTRNEAETVGGAIYNNGAKVTIRRGASPLRSVSFTSNHADRGGAIYSINGQLSIDGVEFADNSATGAERRRIVTGNGGALDIVVRNPLDPPATITQAYFHGNSATGHGGAVNADSTGDVDVSASTFWNDRAKRGGGGIYSRGSLNVINSTFLGEHERDGVFVENGLGGLGKVTFSTIVTSTLGGSISLSNSILRDDVCLNAIGNLGYNLRFQSTTCPSSILNQNPLLSPSLLANNGGPTPTIALESGSPAINAIPPGNCIDQNSNRVTTDQRGYGRPAPGSTYCDEGAFEFGAVPAP